MFGPITDTINLSTNLGHLGSIQAWDPWNSRESIDDARWWVAKIASLSYGNNEAKNPESLFNQIVRCGHLSCLEFVPFDDKSGGYTSLPGRSWRQASDGFEWERTDGFNCEVAKSGRKSNPASAFLVETPIFVARQWMRHRAFSYLEMSRRYTKGSKIEWQFYGNDDHTSMVNELCVAAYEDMISAGVTPEKARRIIPVGAMTKFWVAGYDRDWEVFIHLRSDNHAQEEIRLFSDLIRNIIEGKK